MVGRTAEKAVLTGYLDRLQEGLSGVILIEGQPGIGKSRLVADLLQQASARGLAGWVGAGEALEESTPYHAWRPIFLHLFGMDEAMEPEARRARVLKRLATEPETLRLAPLLNAVMALDLEENEVTRELTGEVRADNTHDLLVRLLQSAEPAAPLLLVLEDAQWLDSASWALALQASKHVQPLLLVMAARPMDSHQPEPYLNLREASGTQRLVLDALSLDNTRQLLVERLGVSRLAEPLVALIHDWAEGNPFFTEELAYFLRDRGLIRVTDGVCRIAPNVGDVTLSSLPKSIEVVIASRIGQLTAEQQFTLKVASAVGRAFPYRLLKDIYPIDVDGAQLHKDLDALEHLGIIAPVSTAASLTYMFRQVITRRVVYRRLPFSLRRQLHRAIAEWYERSYADDLSPFFALLAHHWYRVTGLSAEPELELPVEGDLLRPLKVEGAVRAPSTAEVDSYAVAKTIDYYEKAGEQALRNFANEEAVAFFSRARDLDALAGHPSDATRRACWELQLGEAYANRWSQYPEGRRHLEAGLSLLGQPVPSGLLGQVAGLGGQVFRQVVYRLQSPAPPSRSPERRATLLAAARAYEMLAEVYYFAGETILALIAALRALNLAEAAGPSPELARGFASVGALMGLIPQRGMAEAYARRALEAVAEAGNLPTQAFVSLTSGFYHAGTGAWTGALEHFEKVVKISEHLGDRRRYEDGLSNLMCMSYLQGRFSHGAEVAQRLYESAVRRGDASYQANGLQGKANCLLQLGRFDEAMECLRASQGLLAEQTKVPDEMLGVELHGLLSLAYLRQCEWDQALEATEQVMEAVTATMPSNYGAFPAYANAPEVYLTLWEAEHPAPQLDAQAHKACRALQGYARVFPVGQPRALLWQGLYAWLSGNQAKAHDAWRKSLAAAENLAMPYDQGLAHYEIGRHLQKDAPNRGQTLSRAGEFFEELGAAYHLNLVQAKLVEV
jgi:tetratricopeptide (TPR) repeat protein